MFFGEEKDLDHIQMVRAHIRSHLKAMLGFEDTSGVEVHALVRALARLCEFVESQRPGSPELSGPRWGLLLRLMVAERHGNQDDLTPTSLSHFEGVSKNTISSLLRGLEEQGYVTSVEQEGKRVYTITDEGRRFLAEHSELEQEIKEHLDDWRKTGNIDDIRKTMHEFGRIAGRLWEARQADPEKLKRVGDILSRTYEEIENILKD